MKLFYHSTASETAAIGIIKEGILPDLSKTQGLARPVEGRVYMAKHLKDTLPYLLGGAMCGHSLPVEWIAESPFGYLFIVDFEHLSDIQPDEDQVGQAIHDQKFGWTKSYEKILKNHPPIDEEEECFFQNLYEQVRDGEYAAWIKAGHILLPLLTEEEKIEIIDQYGNLAHLGKVLPIEGWKFDKNLCPQLKEDGSNFFELATKVF